LKAVMILISSLRKAQATQSAQTAQTAVFNTAGGGAAMHHRRAVS